MRGTDGCSRCVAPPEGADDVAPKSGVGPSETGGISVPEDQMGAHGGGGRGGH